MAPAGVVLYPKPAGVTSHDVVARVRRQLREQTGEKQRVGHAGTLDPFATGLLLVLVGAATRMQRFLMALPKTYRTVAKLGWTSDTGEVDGERLYKKARRGEAVEGEARPVHVYRFEELWREDDRAGLEIECSAGTYVRQLVANLNDAYCEELERTAIGHFRLEDADPERTVPLEEALDFIPEVTLDPHQAERVRHGVAVDCRPSTVDYVRLTHEGKLIAIAEAQSELLKPKIVMPR